MEICRYQGWQIHTNIPIQKFSIYEFAKLFLFIFTF